MKTILKKVSLVVLIILAVIVVIGLAIWGIDGRSPQAIIVRSMLSQMTMQMYEDGMADKTDKSVIEIPASVEFPREVSQFKVGNMQVFEVQAEDDTKPIVLYIHGGAYANNFAVNHWDAIAEWAEMTGCGIVAPNYPLLPLHTAKEAHPLMMQLYQQLVKQYSAKRIIIMGDSAGGGFTLALAQQVKAKGIDLPRHLVLISPWVDVMGGDPALQDKDNWLTIEVLQKIGAKWANEIQVNDPMISPLYGDMKGLPPTDLYTGTWEIFYTDVVSTYDKMKSAGVDAQLHIAQKMGHVYPLWPCPEGKTARKQIAEIINGD